MANVKREAVPKTAAVRLRAGRVGLRRNGLTAPSAREAFGRLVHGGRVVCLSKGAVSFADAVGYGLKTVGPADVALATWTVGSREIGVFRDLLAGGSVRSLKLMVDASFPARNPAYAAQLRASFGADCIRLAVCHLKLATIINDRWAVVVLSSANLNRNSRLEFFQIEDNARLATAINSTLGEWFSEPAADHWDASRAEHRRRFEAWGETTGTRAPKAAPRDTVAPQVALVVAADSHTAGALDVPVQPLAPATAADGAFFSDDPWGVDLRRVGISFTR